MKKEKYEQALREKQRELALLQQAWFRNKGRAIVVFEGTDAAGKGGVIRRISWALDPRNLRVYSTSAPNGEEARQHWMKRFWRRVPDQGIWAIFDRSWYGRVLVERVEGFASRGEWERAYNEIVTFEKALVDEDIRIVKIQLEISPETQLERFRARYHDPSKRWKLTGEDIRNRHRHKDYVTAFNDMRKHTSWDGAPWHVIEADDKRVARLACFDLILDQLGRDVALAPPPVPHEVQTFFDKLDG